MTRVSSAGSARHRAGPGQWTPELAARARSLATAETARAARNQAVEQVRAAKQSLTTLISDVPARNNDPTVGRCTAAILAMALERRHIEYFVWTMAHLEVDGRPTPFTAFTNYGKTGHVEWFAETYALAAVNPDRLRQLNPAAADWFAQNLPGLPTNLDPLP